MYVSRMVVLVCKPNVIEWNTLAHGAEGQKKIILSANHLFGPNISSIFWHRNFDLLQKYLSNFAANEWIGEMLPKNEIFSTK